MATHAHSIEPTRPHDSDTAALELLASFPNQYALRVEGECLTPQVHNADVLLFDKSEPFKRGDLVVLFRRCDPASRLPFRAEVKRLVMAPPSWVTFPWHDHPQSDVVPLIVLEMINPQRHFAVRCAEILAIHKCVGDAPADAPRGALPPASASAPQAGG